MKKLLLTTTAFALLSAGVMAQGVTFQKPLKKGYKNAQSTNERRDFSTPDLKSGQKLNRGCGTPSPSKDWDDAFNAMVEQHKADLAANRTTATTYTIPIIFHIIHEGEAEGVGHNISQAQVNSQIPVLNADYNGTGYNTSLYAAMTYSGQPAFYQYAAATTNSVSAASKASNGSIAIGASGVYFCLATKNPSGTTLAEPGIDRQPYTVGGNTTKPSASSNVQTLMDGTIKPATIWDPTKYFNVWVSDGGTSGLLGYATFPPVSATGSAAVSSSQNGAASGSFGMTATNQSTTDGVWCVYTGLGTTGAVTSPYNKGRTLTHESGHWLGLRHIWGDGSCVNDYCNDTPPAAAANYVNCGTAYPYHAGTCTSSSVYSGNGTTTLLGTQNNSIDGEMYMNFMDYSDDCGMWMFTNDQVNRIHASLAGSAYRSGLTTSAANLCAGVTVSTPTAAFTPPSSICSNVSVTFTDGSSGPPTSWAWSVNPSTGVVFTSSTVANPGITFPAAGTYTVTDAVSNSAGSNSVSQVVTVTSCTTSSCDTLSNMLSTDTLTIYTVTKGYLSGSGGVATNTATPTVPTLTAQALGEVYSSSSFPTNVTQVKGAMILFYRDAANNIGTKGTTGTITVAMTGTTTSTYGTVPNATSSATQTVSMASIVSQATTAGVDYAGNTLFDYTGYMIAYPVMFTTPVTMPTGFALTVTTPTAVTADTIVVWSNSGTTQSTATGCIKYKSSSSTTWYNGSAFGINPSFAIIPIVCPATTTGIEANQLGSSITLFPNPNSGQFNFAISLPESTNLNFTIVNMLGQVVYTKAENNVTNTVLSVDLSNLAKGIYYANITDSNNNKTVKKIIIQ
jgi:hypothetical protein